MNRPRNVLLQHADPREPVTVQFHHTVGALRHSLRIQQSPDDACWPGGALWDCGVLLSQLLLAVAGIEDVTLRSTYLEEDTTHHIIVTTKKKGKAPQKLQHQQQQTRTTTQMATRLKTWIAHQESQNNSNNYPQIWNDTVLQVLWHTPQLRVLELGCGVGLTGLVASVALGAVTTILTDLTEVMDGITVGNVEHNTTNSSGKKKASSSGGDTLSTKYPCRAIQNFKGGGKVVAMPLGWGNLEEGRRVMELFERLQPPTLNSVKGKHKKKAQPKPALAPPSDDDVDNHRFPHLILLGDVAYQHKPGAPSHFDILVETLQQFMPPSATTDRTTLLLFGTRLRMPASLDLLLLLQEHFEEVLPTPIPAHILDPALEGVKHNMTIHIFGNRINPGS